MEFCIQLRMLLWKNLLLRRRQKFRCLVEIIWPTFLFLILMWIRTKGLRTEIHECHFSEKAMPSAGTLAFFQTFFCTLNNTCYKYENMADVRDSINGKSILDLYNRFKSIPTKPQELQIMKQVTRDVEEVTRIMQNSNLSLRNNHGNLTVPKLFNNQDKFKEEIKRRKLPLSAKSVDSLLNSHVSLDNVLSDDYRSLYRDNVSLLLCNKTLMENLIMNVNPGNLYSEMCKFSRKDLDNLIASGIKEVKNERLFVEMNDVLKKKTYESFSMQELFKISKLLNDINNNLRSMYVGPGGLINNLTVLSNTYERLKEDLRGRAAFNTEDRNEWANEMLYVMKKFLCGYNETIDDDASQAHQPTEQTTRRPSYRKRIDPETSAPRVPQQNKKEFDELSDQLIKRLQISYVYDNSTTKECNDLFMSFEHSIVLRAAWRLYKPFVRGKFLYTPKTAATERIMKKLNSTFDFINDAANLFQSGLMHSSKEFLESAIALESFKKLIESEAGGNLFDDVNFKMFSNETSLNSTADILDSINSFLAKSELYDSTEEQNMMNMLKNVSQFLQCFEKDRVVDYDSEEEAVKEGLKLLEDNTLLAVIVFEHQVDDNLTPFLTYKIRMSSERVDNTEFLRDTMRQPGPRMRPFIDLKYFTFGFIIIQDLLERFIIMEQTGREDSQLPGFYFKQFPSPCYISDEFIVAISKSFPLFMVLSWVYTCAMIAKSVVYEKEMRLKETMRVMGLENGVHWAGWFIDSLLPMTITVLLLTIILVYGNILRNADATLVFCFVFLYGLATISQAFLISVFFSRANIAAACGGLIFFLLYLPYPVLINWMYQISAITKALMCLSSNVAFGLGASYLSMYEERGTGIHWSDIATSPLYKDEFSLLFVMLLLLVDCVVYFMLAWYIEGIMPGQFGVPKPWYFPVSINYWRGTSKIKEDPAAFRVTNSNDDRRDDFEKEPTSLKVGITVNNLTKIFVENRKVVNNLSINFYEDQITSFLGHNGAGKTTTISILTGLYTPTKGTAYINGMDIRTNMSEIRKSLGMCPQYNVLFDHLTVEEHLYFFAMLRGHKDGGEVQEEIDKMLEDLKLPNKKDCLSKNLSGGMKRKLSIAVAFIGGSKTVILDEPTSGVDPYSRRAIWELLMKYKKGRTILLTTHYMDEADFLGDRIAIIANGELQCCGSSIFLKNHFGSGYYLTIDMKQTGVTAKQRQDYFSDVTTFVKTTVPSAQVVEEMGSTIVFVLPERKNIDELKELLIEMEAQQKNLNIDSYGISDTALEEIFLRVALKATAEVGIEPETVDNSCGARMKRFLRIKKPPRLSTEVAEGVVEPDVEIEIDDENDFERVNSSVPMYSAVPVSEDGEPIKPGRFKFIRQYSALFIKRFHHNRRKRRALIANLLLPPLFICVTLILTSILPHLEQRPAIVLKPSMYGSERFIFTDLRRDPSGKETWPQQYYNTLLDSLGLGISCNKNNDVYNDRDIIERPCSKVLHYDVGVTNVSQFGPDCSCASGSQVCPLSPDELPTPPSVQLRSLEVAYDFDTSNISDWLLKTHSKYGITRLAGYNLGYVSPLPEFKEEMILALLQNAITPEDFDAAAIYKENNIRIWFNNKGWISPVAYMNAINNVVLRTSLPDDKKAFAEDYGIRAINHPMNFTKKQMNIEVMKHAGLALLHSVAILFALSFVPASFTLYLIEDRITNSKHLQMVSGMSRLVYWTQAFIWDITCYLFPAILIVLMFVAFNELTFISSRSIYAFMVLLLVYGFACIPLMYPFTFIFKVPSSAYISLACTNMFLGVITTLTSFVLNIFDDPELQHVDEMLRRVFIFLPHFCLGDGLMKIANNYMYYIIYQSLDIELDNAIFSWDMIGKHIFVLILCGFLYFFITLLIEYNAIGFLNCCWRPSTKSYAHDTSNEDMDVKNERQRITSGQKSDDILVIKDLVKVFRKGGKPSVDRICMGSKKGECFGLLGLNGAGKTTTFKMLTGEIRPTSGDAFVHGYSLSRDKTKVQSHLGYCPQFDALDSHLTPREHLEFYARIRNIPSKQTSTVVKQCLKKLNLGNYSDRCAGSLSGGNKRKLATAIAILGNPYLILLDEPTSGMDPRARRFLWSTVQSLVREGHLVILTSHSMEECQALCTKLTIMVNGQFKCLGTSQHLKTKFGGGYRVILRCVEGEGKVSAVKSYMKTGLGKAILQEEYHTRLCYQLPSKTHPLDEVFSVMEAARVKKMILDYSLSQTTLEDVFMQFAAEQSEGAAVPKHKLRNILPACCQNCSSCFKGD